MKEKIKQIRVRIDGLAQLVKAIGNQPVFIIDGNSIPPDVTLEEVRGSLHLKKNISIDGLKYEKHIPPVPYAMSDCYKSLLLAKAWLGKVLAALGEDTPYKNDGKREEVKDIEPAADHATDMDKKKIESEVFSSGDKWEGNNYIKKIDWLREDIKGVCKVVDETISSYVNYSKLESAWVIIKSKDLTEQHLSEARFHLGFELGRIKEVENDN